MPQAEHNWDPPDDFPDDFDGYVGSSTFGYKETYQNGTRLLAILMLITDVADKPIEAIFSMGDGWTCSTDGRYAMHPANPDPRNPEKLPSKNTLYGKLAVRVAKDLGVELAAKGVRMQARGPLTDAYVWTGLNFHWKRDTFKYAGKAFADKGGSVEAEHLMPSKFLGLVVPGQVLVGTQATALAPTPAAPAVSNGVLEAELKKLVEISTTIQEFQIKAINLDGVIQSDTLKMQVLDTGTTGFWATYKK